ncbi:MAG: hydrogenase expression/formation protein HypE [Propionibacteriaceae bacterium]|jgi:hydrogenase expression/formation protein HypE|nr:hydrogenase expression/formation protein HypE [Propionibacteriaceae bacterium]
MDEVITLAHGAGGKASAWLIDEVFISAFGRDNPAELTDAALLAASGRLAFSTDSYVVNPIRFPGGSIGELAVNGTVNDLAVSGARPQWLSAAFVIEEGLGMGELSAIVQAMAAAAKRAGVRIVTGDTKVVPRGAADKLFITTAGIGLVPKSRMLGAGRIGAGDAVIGSGPIAGHGMAVLLARGDLALDADIRSDSAPLNGLVEALYAAGEPSAVRWMRDATRGGLGTVANELARAAGLGILLDDERIRIDPVVRGACDMLGIDPLYVANEGFFVAVVAADAADAAVRALRGAGADQAGTIGQVIAEPPGIVAIRNAFGGTRLVDMMIGDPLPRIC